MGDLKILFRIILSLSVLLFPDKILAQYFQQRVEYKINVRLNDRNNSLTGDELINYINNSRDTLKFLYFHLWPSAYKDDNTVLAKEIFKTGDDRFLSSDDDERGFIDSLDFRIDAEKAEWNTLDDTIDVCKIILNKPLPPGDSIIITTPFHVKIPSAELSRLGHHGQAYFISQWYPKPAVYDKNGWNYFPYLDQGEYYSEFGSFDVSITLPDNYVLGATGRMINAEKEFDWLIKKDSITRSIQKFVSTDDSIVSSPKYKTIRFTQDSIHDFAWFADKRWHVLMDTISLPSKKEIISFSFFNNQEGKFWLKSPEYISTSIKYGSEWLGEYPYDFVTAVDVGNATGNGMEYPMITAIGNYGDPFELEVTIAHEVGHNWFYGILASNERCHPLMDEGFTNFFETRYVYTKYKSDSIHQLEGQPRLSLFLAKSENHRIKQYNDYVSGARENTDQNQDQCSELISTRNYHGDVYFKTAISTDYLKDYLGDSLFDVCMHNYYDEWKFRHPEPEDLRNAFATTSGKSLDWYFKDLLNSSKKLDYKIKGIKKENNKEIITLRNAGEIDCPVLITGIKDGKINSHVWIDGFKGIRKIEFENTGEQKFEIDPEKRMPDLFTNNNSISSSGILKRTERIHFYPGTRFENAEETQLYYFPVAGWNYYDRFLAGLIIHNISFLEKKYEFNLMPLYSSRQKDLNGAGTFRYYLYPDNSKLEKITLQTGIYRYAFGNDEYNTDLNNIHYINTLKYFKTDSKIVFSFGAADAQQKIKNEITFRSVIINRDIPYFIEYKQFNHTIYYWQIKALRENDNEISPSSQHLNLTFNNQFVNANAELTGVFNYEKKDKGFTWRLFTGFENIFSSNTFGVDYRMQLDGASGLDDYLFDEIYLGRSEESGILSKQFIANDGGFKTPTSFYRLAEKWLTAINISTTLPGFIPFRLFADLASFDNIDLDNQFGKISWEIGVSLPVIKNTFIIYFPFAYSNDIKWAINNQRLSQSELIRFELHLNNLNPLDFIKRFYSR